MYDNDNDNDNNERAFAEYLSIREAQVLLRVLGSTDAWSTHNGVIQAAAETVQERREETDDDTYDAPQLYANTIEALLFHLEAQAQAQRTPPKPTEEILGLFNALLHLGIHILTVDLINRDIGAALS